MIYVKDYQTLGVFPDSGTFRDHLAALVGSTVIIFVEGGHSFTGLLLEVLSDRVRLMTSPPSGPHNTARCRSCKSQTCRFGSCATILIRAITAVSSNYT